MADRTKVQRDKHESPTERPREAKMARAAQRRNPSSTTGTKGATGTRSTRTSAKMQGTTTTRGSSSATRGSASGRKTVAARNRSSRPRRPAERLNRPKGGTSKGRRTNDAADFPSNRLENAPAGTRRAATLSNEEVTSPDVSLEFAHGPEGEAHAGQDLREPRMIPPKGGKDKGARSPKGRAEQRPDDRHAEGET